MIESIGRSVLDAPPSQGMTSLYPSLQGANATKQSMSRQAVTWIASLRSQ
jgi:hypothetical protein